MWWNDCWPFGIALIDVFPPILVVSKDISSINILAYYIYNHCDAYPSWTWSKRAFRRFSQYLWRKYFYCLNCETYEEVILTCTYLGPSAWYQQGSRWWCHVRDIRSISPLLTLSPSGCPRKSSIGCFSSNNTQIRRCTWAFGDIGTKYRRPSSGIEPAIDESSCEYDLILF